MREGAEGARRADARCGAGGRARARTPVADDRVELLRQLSKASSVLDLGRRPRLVGEVRGHALGHGGADRRLRHDRGVEGKGSNSRGSEHFGVSRSRSIVRGRSSMPDLGSSSSHRSRSLVFISGRGVVSESEIKNISQQVGNARWRRGSAEGATRQPSSEGGRSSTR